jgi:hypothetical protein
MKTMKIIIVCDKCGNEIPEDMEKSNDNWKVSLKKCECGGKPKFIIK